MSACLVETVRLLVLKWPSVMNIDKVLVPRMLDNAPSGGRVVLLVPPNGIIAAVVSLQVANP